MDGFRLVREKHCKIWEIEPRKKYRILSGVSHVYVRAGKISFFAPIYNGEASDIKTKRGTFLAVPFGMKFVEFPEFYKNSGGYHYGKPSWYVVKTC